MDLTMYVGFYVFEGNLALEKMVEFLTSKIISDRKVNLASLP